MRRRSPKTRRGAAPALVVTAPLASDVPAPRGEELADAGRAARRRALGTATRAYPQTATFAQARAWRRRGAMRLVFVQPAIARGAFA